MGGAQASGEAPAARRRHAAYYLDLAEAAEPKLGGPDQRLWLDRLEEEHDNLRAALSWSQSTLERCQSSAAGPGSAEPRGRRGRNFLLWLASALAWFWWVRGHVSEGRHWLERMLTPGTAASATVRAKAFDAAGALARDIDDQEVAVGMLEEALALARVLVTVRIVANTLRQLGCLAADSGTTPERENVVKRAWRSRERLGTAGRSPAGLTTRRLWRIGGVHAQAEALYDECVSLFEEVGDMHYLAWSLFSLANVLRDRGDYDRAAALQERVVSLAQDLGHDDLSAWARYGLGFVAAITGRNGRAVRTCVRASGCSAKRATTEGSPGHFMPWPWWRRHAARMTDRRGCSEPPTRCANEFACRGGLLSRFALNRG